jgi:hypothetical protein
VKLLVSGCGRSGTKFLARAIAVAGVTCTHEEAFTPDRAGTGEWAEWQAEVSWCAAPHTPLAGVHVVHLVRHPLDVIRSRVDKGTFAIRWSTKDEQPRLGPWARWAYRWCPGMKLARTEIEASAIHWVQWNRLVVADEVLRLEDVDVATITRLARIVDPSASGIVTLPPPVDAIPTAKRSPRPTWDDLAAVPGFEAMARRFGYLP